MAVASHPIPSKPTKISVRLMHGWRVGVFVAILWLIHDSHKARQADITGSGQISVEVITNWFPTAHHMGTGDPRGDLQIVHDKQDQELGYILLTAPISNEIIGYSGSNDILAAFNTEHHLLGLRVLSSGDTSEYVTAVTNSPTFLKQFVNETRSRLAKPSKVDAVSGATLTSLAMAEGLAKRLGNTTPSLRFPEPIGLPEVKVHLPEATLLEPNASSVGLLLPRNANGAILGQVFRISPEADAIIGYQGPTDALVIMDASNRLESVHLRSSFETEKYLNYIREDDYFLKSFKGMELLELADLDIRQAQVEGVSGATMTSLALTEGLIASAKNRLKPSLQNPDQKKWKHRDWGTASMVLVALCFTFTSLRGNTRVRLVFRVILVVYLGFINADLLSQTLLAGWARNGIAWQSTPGLVLLVLAALVVPMATGRQLYCHHLCPHGALQEWLRNRLPWQWSPTGRWDKMLRVLPATLLATSLMGAMGLISLDLADLEPFNAYSWRTAGMFTVVTAVLGILSSAFVPMAFCRFACPTGALLKFLRLFKNSDRWVFRDSIALVFFLTALALYWITF